MAILQELLPILKTSLNQGAGASKIGFILYLLQGAPSLVRLREAIFKSGLHPSLNDMSQLTGQHDAASVAELMIDHFLPNCKFKMRETATADDFPGMEFIGPLMDMTILQIPLRPKVSKMTELIKWVLQRHVEKENDPKYQRRFDPQDGKVLNSEKAAPALAAQPQKLAKFVQSYKLTELPAVLTIHFKRFGMVQGKDGTSLVPVKDSSPVLLPSEKENGIIDLTRYYDAPEGASTNGPIQAKYKIKSFVAHKGSSVKSGHYVTCVEIRGKYYLCDDTDPNFFKEITQKEFFGRKDAYLLVLERLPEDGAAEQGAENTSET